MPDVHMHPVRQTDPGLYGPRKKTRFWPRQPAAPVEEQASLHSMLAGCAKNP